MDGVDIGGMFLLGLIGTGHCIGMCGPLIFAFPGRTGRLMPHLAYHAGRVATYTGIGAVLGGIGQLMAGAAAGAGGGVATVKIVLWLVAALFLLVLGTARLGIFPEPRWLSVVDPSRMPWFKTALQGEVVIFQTAEDGFDPAADGALPEWAVLSASMPVGRLLGGGGESGRGARSKFWGPPPSGHA